MWFNRLLSIQFASSTQFYLYGKKYCTKTGWEAASNKYPIPDILSDVSLDGNVYLVTGANAGIGVGIASFLAKHGARVYLVCRSAERGTKARDAIAAETQSDKVHLLQCDCSLEVGPVLVAADNVSFAHFRLT